MFNNKSFTQAVTAPNIPEVDAIKTPQLSSKILDKLQILKT